jgi:hypothetical protein
LFLSRRTVPIVDQAFGDPSSEVRAMGSFDEGNHHVQHGRPARAQEPPALDLVEFLRDGGVRKQLREGGRAFPVEDGGGLA